MVVVHAGVTAFFYVSNNEVLLQLVRMAACQEVCVVLKLNASAFSVKAS